MRTVAGVLAMAGVMSCATPNEGDAPPPAQAESRVGMAAVAGTAAAQWVELRGDDGASVRVVGELEPEIRALRGARLRAVGVPAEEPGMGPAFRVLDYDVLEIDGAAPIVGALLRVGSDFWIAEPDSIGGQRLRLIGVPEAIGEATGGKIWVVGVRGTSEVRVQSYGVIRSAPR